MKKIMYIAVAAIAVLSSCSSEEFAENSSNINNNGGVKVFKATIENDGEGTRSTLVGNTANWELTDKVCINGAVYSVTPVEGNAAKATLSYESGTAPTEGDTYKAFYADGANSGNYWDSENEAFKLPASYTYAEGKFNMPMYAEGTSTELVFQNICGVLAVKVTSAQMSKVTRVTVTSDKSISGACTISATEGKYSATATGTDDDDKTVILDCGDGVTIAETGTVFYIPVPAGSHTLRVAVSNDNTEKYMTTSSAVTIARNNIYNLTFDGKHEIHFVTIAGLRWSTMNVGATEVAESAEKSYGGTYAWGEIATYYTSIEYTDCKTVKRINWNTAEDNKPTHYPGAKTAYNWKNYTENASADWDGQYNHETNKLYLSNDVANYTLGGTWRMPTIDEFDKLHVACGGTSMTEYVFDDTHKPTADFTASRGEYFVDYTEGGITATSSSMSLTMKIPGFLFCDVNGKMVFFPNGVFIADDIPDMEGYYVTSNYYSNSNCYIVRFLPNNIRINTGCCRCYGYPVRPVSK